MNLPPVAHTVVNRVCANEKPSSLTNEPVLPFLFSRYACQPSQRTAPFSIAEFLPEFATLRHLHRTTTSRVHTQASTPYQSTVSFLTTVRESNLLSIIIPISNHSSTSLSFILYTHQTNPRANLWRTPVAATSSKPFSPLCAISNLWQL